MRTANGEPRPHLVLVGGGHAHVQVLRHLMMTPWRGVDVTLVVDDPVAVYSGMVPALVAGEIARHEVEIDVRPLARRAGVAVVVAAATRVDAEARRLYLEGRPAVAYDVLSVNIGSTVSGRHIDGVREHAVASRPITRLVDRFEAALERFTGDREAPIRLVVVGAGAGGVELICCGAARLQARGFAVHATLVSASAHPLGADGAMSRAVAKALEARGVHWEPARRVVGVHADHVILDDTRRLDADLVLWVTGAKAHAFASDSGLPVDDRGFVWVDDHMEVEGHRGIFAVGDCARQRGHAWVPRAGVYAVRAGPVLIDNLRARLMGGSARPYRPQRDFLSMLNLGDQTALASKWGVVMSGGWVWRWKDRIDRRFMDRFQLLGPDGAPRSTAPAMSMDEEMFCGGCAAKVDAVRLSSALDGLAVQDDPRVSVGLAHRDDVAVLSYGGSDVVVSVDAFPAFTDDPWLVGMAAVRNATSDLYAKGAQPRHALAWITVPRARGAREVLQQALAGVQRALAEESITLAGGHTTLGDELSIGLTVLGDRRGNAALWTQSSAEVGDVLVLTKALGIGVLWRTDAMGLSDGRWMQAAVSAVLARQDVVAQVVASVGVHAATDVTGFGLAGHAAAMASASDVGLEIWASALPALPGAREVLGRGHRSTAHVTNEARTDVRCGPDVSAVDRALAFDPQTCGGLLLAVPPSRADALCEALRAVAPDVKVIGRVVPASGWAVELVAGGGSR